MTKLILETTMFAFPAFGALSSFNRYKNFLPTLEIGSRGDDTFYSNGGTQFFIGQRGDDTLVIDGAMEDYDFLSTFRPHKWAGSPLALLSGTNALGQSETITIVGVEQIFFAGDDYTLYLDGRNNEVLAADDSVAAVEDVALQIDVADLLANDFDADGDVLSVSSVAATSQLGASVTIENGVITYLTGDAMNALAEGEVVTDTFVYTVTDGYGSEVTATVSVEVAGTNDAPVVTVAPSVDVAENQTAVATASATDVDGDTVTWSLSGNDAANFSINADGEISFIDAPDYEADPTSYNLTVTATDEAGGASSEDLTVNVTDVIEADPTPRINEIHYDNVGTDTGEFYEVRVGAGADVSNLYVQLYNGSNGSSYDLKVMSNATKTSDGTYDYYVMEISGIQNGTNNGSGAADGIALAQNGELIEFLSYEGTMTGGFGYAFGVTSTDIGVAEDSSTPVGYSLQRLEDGTWAEAAPETKGYATGAEPEEPPVDNEIVLISAIQGDGYASGMAGQTVTVSAVVTQITNNGFFVQEEDIDADGNALTSEGIFVYTGGGEAVEIGNLVEVTGAVEEYFGLTQIRANDVVVIEQAAMTPEYVDIYLTPTEALSLEQYEGMLVEVHSGTEDALTIIENYNLARFGEIVVSAGTQMQPTQLYDAQTQQAEIEALNEANGNNRLIFEDNSTSQNPEQFTYLPGGAGDNGNGYLDIGDDFGDDGSTIRLGAEMDSAKGVINYAYGDYRLNVTETLELDPATNEGAREDAPSDVGGTLQVASYNVLNYFTTIDVTGAGTGPDGTLDPRGADSASEFERQSSKIVKGILGTGAEVLALQEIENNGFGEGSAIDTLVGQINAEGGTNFAYVNPLAEGETHVGTDAIMTGIIYNADEVTLVHAEYLVYEESSADTTYAIAGEIADTLGVKFDDFDRNRPSTAATFIDNATGEEFTVVSSHFKSKGDSGLANVVDAAKAHIASGGTDITQEQLDALLADPNVDQGDGQGYWNAVRTDAAIELGNWITTDYNGTGATNVIMMGDMNAYAQEDPVQALGTDFNDLVDEFIGQVQAYSYVFDGMQGSLDQGLADDELMAHVTGVTEWHINADEPGLIGYDDTFTDSAFYNDGVYGSSDHDPLIVGLDFGTADTFLF